MRGDDVARVNSTVKFNGRLGIIVLSLMYSYLCFLFSLLFLFIFVFLRPFYSNVDM